ncbi:hypothetical protein OH76DRAFT_541294 [Lentinus brumalis]|uniref:Secreted protein n=1 Tax=Lentinus brumalis TaxID=2498619 RepID=A0A371D9L8_9APHY|nr:hypothetical protein OH76DRAFT_541294 [Polyporus brumalis]
MGGVTFALQHPCFTSVSLVLLHLRFVLHTSISAATSPPCITSSSASMIFVSISVNRFLRRPHHISYNIVTSPRCGIELFDCTVRCRVYLSEKIALCIIKGLEPSSAKP